MSQENRLYVSNITSAIGEADLELLFSKYGRVLSVEMRSGFAYVEFDQSKDASDAIRGLDGYRLDGSKLVVEVAKSHSGGPRHDNGPPRSSSDRGNKCFNCGQTGHWARECPEPKGFGERSKRYEDNLCFSCGEPGHRARDCPSGNSRRGYQNGRGGDRRGGGGRYGGRRDRYDSYRGDRHRDRSYSGDRRGSYSRRSDSRSPIREKRRRSRSRDRDVDKERRRHSRSRTRSRDRREPRTRSRSPRR